MQRTLKEKLASISSSIDGSLASCFVGYDGLLIEKTNTGNDVDVDLIAATFASVIKNLRSQDNDVIDVVVVFQKDVVFIRTMEDGFLCIVMGQDGNIGRAKLEAKRLGTKFME